MSKYNVGLNNVGSYQASGRPHIDQITLDDQANRSHRVQFANVTKKIIVRTTSSHAVRVHFAPFTASAEYPSYTDDANTGNNFITLSGSGQIELDAKCKEVFISAPLGTAEDVVEIYGELTNIPAGRMFSLDGVTGVSS
tara:strand:+ start:21 stop:437 length:417 start_codon:yes stop_codon:yes gene_type:complete